MYIDPFWVGVVGTILAEIGAIIIGAIVVRIGGKKNGEN